LLLAGFLPIVSQTAAWMARLSAALLWREDGAGLPLLSRARILAPWNLLCADQVTAGDDSEIYNPAPMRFGSHAIVSQGAYLCGATHDYNRPDFPLIAYPMEIGAHAWICARAIVGPGVDVGEGAILGLGAVTTKNLEQWGVYAGNQAVKVKERKRGATGG
jgi:putative colanic acid biosynthesis acetyltransferase WcaF